ncbi:MAG TPA: hypothetical protein VK716_08940 [Terracidiphilus sp.]|nr:hypothetical protein [Terracidiphilus sp.]
MTEPPPDLNPETKFCILMHSGQSIPVIATLGDNALAVLLSHSANQGEFFVNPAWPAFVDSSKKELVASLLDDFSMRSKVDPSSLFRQLKSLNFGPVVTGAVGSFADREPELLDLLSRFQRR